MHRFTCTCTYTHACTDTHMHMHAHVHAAILTTSPLCLAVPGAPVAPDRPCSRPCRSSSRASASRSFPLGRGGSWELAPSSRSCTSLLQVLKFVLKLLIKKLLKLLLKKLLKHGPALGPARRASLRLATINTSARLRGLMDPSPTLRRA